jgi:hypothetical protein
VYSVGSNGKTTVTLELEPNEMVTLSTDQPGNGGVVAMQIQGAPAAVESKRAREENAFERRRSARYVRRAASSLR